MNTIVITILITVCSIGALIYYDSFQTCWRNLVKKMEKDNVFEESENPTFVYNHFTGEMDMVTPFQTLGYALMFFVAIMPIINTIVMFDSCNKIFEILTQKKASAQPFLKKNDEIRSTLYHSIVLQFILKYKFKFKKELYFKQ